MACTSFLVPVATVLFVVYSTLPLSSAQRGDPRRTCLGMCDGNRLWLCGTLCATSGGCYPSCHFSRDIADYFSRCKASCDREFFTTTPKPTATPIGSCGHSPYGFQLQPKIIGGLPAEECEFPWAVVVNVNSVYCGGSIIDSNTVLTAAHCVFSPTRGLASPNSVTVKYGSSNQQRSHIARVTRVIVHPRFILQTFDYDVALLTLDRNLYYGRCVQPVCLPEVDASPYNTQGCMAAGWGATDYTQPAAERWLRKVHLPIVPLNQCSNSYGTRLVFDIKLCAGNYTTGGQDSCLGDSGGPLMCYRDGSYYIYGVVSFGKACGHPYYPGVYSRVTHYLIHSWIRENM